jgi:hypothetical protein
MTSMAGQGGTMTCGSCDGTGIKYGGPPCPACDGTGGYIVPDTGPVPDSQPGG